MPTNPVANGDSEGVFVLRLAAGRKLLDVPGNGAALGVSSIWIDGDPPAWRRAVWPTDVLFGLPIAPLDLSPGQLIEFQLRCGLELMVRYGCVLGGTGTTVVVGATRSLTDATVASRAVHRGWVNAQLLNAYNELRH